ncbi:MAG: endonuclease/exonuclease/phosphatase family protein [Methyloligellaceae bacterium]
MTEIVTWNIQCGLGVDGLVDLERIAGVIRAMGDPDVICLQEVSRYMPDLDGGAGADQVAVLAGLFPDHRPTFGPALDRAGDGPAARKSFGNLVLSRLPVLCVFRHHLPQPAEAGLRHMPRQATEVTVADQAGPLRILTTHLEFPSVTQRQAQIDRLRALHSEAAANVRQPPEAAETGPYEPLPRPADCILCGDFNLEPEDPEYAGLLAGFADGTPALLDAWPEVHGDRPHDPTCGIFDEAQWPAGPNCRDFFFMTPALIARTDAIRVDVTTQASDHQPVLVRLREATEAPAAGGA